MRLVPPSDPVTIRFDGEEVIAERGEPVAVALIAAGHLALARSSKFHRPRGPSCLRAGCDGCLARVDETPNVMTCMVPAKDGMVVEAQNTLGTLDVDFLRVTDWFFPHGMNHHELFAGVPGLQSVMQAFARRVAGLGRLPKELGETRAARRRSVDALVVGGGPAGMAAACELVDSGRSVEVVEDGLQVGAWIRALGAPWAPLVERFARAVDAGRVGLRVRTTAGGVFGDDVLVAGKDGAEVLTAADLVLAPGAHDGALAFEGNDLPGVMSARAGAALLARGIAPGKRLAIVACEGSRTFADACVARLAGVAGVAATRLDGTPARASGSSHVKDVTVRGPDGKEITAKCDALLIDAPRAPAYELCAQAGAELEHRPFGFFARGPRIRDGVWAIGEAIGTPLDPAAMIAEARALAQSSSRAPKSASPPATPTTSNTPSKSR